MAASGNTCMYSMLMSVSYLCHSIGCYGDQFVRLFPGLYILLPWLLGIAKRSSRNFHGYLTKSTCIVIYLSFIAVYVSLPMSGYFQGLSQRQYSNFFRQKSTMLEKWTQGH